VIDEAAVPRDVAEKHPPGTAGEIAGKRHELAAPAVDRSEVADDRARDRLRDGSAVAAEAGKVELVQQRRIQCRDLVPLETADRVAWRRGQVQSREFLGNRVQARDRAAVVVLVMALDQARRDAVERPGAAEERSGTVLYVRTPFGISGPLRS
jgi:hypothetical protein